MVAPQLPEVLRTALEQARRSASATARAAASVYPGRQVLVADVGKDPFWEWHARGGAGCRPARRPGRRRSQAAGGHVLGALGVYRAEPGVPTAAEEGQIMARAAQLAGIAIERRRAEEALRGSEAKFRGLFESIAEGVYQSGRDGRLLSVNPAFVAMCSGLWQRGGGVRARRPRPRSGGDPADRAEFARRVDSQGEIRDAEFLMRRKDGQQLVVLENARSMRDAAGRHIGYDGTIANITERKRAEQAIFAEKERAQVTLQSIGDAGDQHRRGEGASRYINPVAESLTALEPRRWRVRPADQRRAESRQRADARADREFRGYGVLGRAATAPRAHRSLGAHHARRARGRRSRNRPPI